MFPPIYERIAMGNYDLTTKGLGNVRDSLVGYIAHELIERENPGVVLGREAEWR